MPTNIEKAIKKQIDEALQQGKAVIIKTKGGIKLLPSTRNVVIIERGGQK